MIPKFWIFELMTVLPVCGSGWLGLHGPGEVAPGELVPDVHAVAGDVEHLAGPDHAVVALDVDLRIVVSIVGFPIGERADDDPPAAGVGHAEALECAVERAEHFDRRLDDVVPLERPELRLAGPLEAALDGGVSGRDAVPLEGHRLVRVGET
jgi:hypothetical protein